MTPEDFQREEGPEIDPLEVRDNPNFTLYCPDPQRNAVLFVELPEDARPEQAPFYYVPQFDQAVGLVSMPEETFHQVAETLPDLGCNLVFVHSVGRCGSTLLSKALAAIPSVHSLSEPDDLTRLTSLRPDDGSRDEWIRRMVRSSILWRGKRRHGAPYSHLAIKTRSEVMRLADVMVEQFPEAKNIFLYRTAVGWSDSLFRAQRGDREFYDHDLNREMFKQWCSFMPLLKEYDREPPMHPIEIRLVVWITIVEAYLDLVEKGVPFIAARFEELVRDPVSMLHQIFDWCGINAVDWDEVARVLAKDSQEGTFFDRTEIAERGKVTPEAIKEDARTLVATRPRIGSAHAILPNTIGV